MSAFASTDEQDGRGAMRRAHSTPDPETPPPQQPPKPEDVPDPAHAPVEEPTRPEPPMKAR